jgi:hypothetical protein
LGEGGQDLRGTFRIKKASKNFFPEMLATGGGGGGSFQKFFPDIPHFFVNMKKIFPIYQKIFRIYDIFPGNEKNCPLGKKCNLNDNF